MREYLDWNVAEEEASQQESYEEGSRHNVYGKEGSSKAEDDVPPLVRRRQGKYPVKLFFLL